MKKFLFLLVTMFTFLGHQANAQQIGVNITSAAGNIGDTMDIPVFVTLPPGITVITSCQGAIVSSNPSAAEIVGIIPSASNITTVIVNSGMCIFSSSASPILPANGLFLTLRVRIANIGCSNFTLSPTGPASPVEFVIGPNLVFDDLATDFNINTGTVCSHGSCPTCIDFDAIQVVSANGCNYQFDMDYSFESVDCGKITLVSETWNFGHQGGTGSGQVINHTFPISGTYTVTATVQFITGNGQLCSEQLSLDVTVQGCNECLVGPPSTLNCKKATGPVGGSSSTHTLSWNAVSGAVSYEVQFVYNDPACCPGIIATPTSTIVATGSTSMIVQTGACYSWRVRSVCANGAKSAWSSRSCTCAYYSSDSSSGGKSLTPSDDSFEAGQVRLAAVPNPATNHVDITLSGVSAEMTLDQPEVFIFDLAGKVIFSSQLNVDEAKRVDLSDFEPGTYIIKAVDGDTILSTEKLVVQ